MKNFSLFTFLLVAVFIPATNLYAQTADPTKAVYTISDVSVDITADSAAHARTKAIPTVQRQALGQLFERLDVNPALADKLSDNDLFTLVKNFDVQSEKTSSVRYIGIYTIQFRPAAVRDFLTRNQRAFTDTAGPPVVVLPILKTGQQLTLWQEPTAWHTVWDNASKHGDLVPVIVPAGTMADVTILTPDEAVAGNADVLHSIATKYNASGTVVALLDADLTKVGGDYNVDIVHWGLQDTVPPSTVHLHLPGPSDMASVDGVLQQAVRLTREQIEKDWKQNLKMSAVMPLAATPQPMLTAPDLHLPVSVPVATPQEWGQMARRLSNIEGIVQTSVRNLARGNVTVEIEYRGTVEQLQASLSRNGLLLLQDNVGWTLKSIN